MARELAVGVYLFIFRSLFNLCKLFPLKRKTVFVASFGINIIYTKQEVKKRHHNEKIVILKTSTCSADFGQSPKQHILTFQTIHIVDWVRSIYHLATSQVVFVDNYYGFLTVTNFKPGVKCVQLWHAVGAIKQFGLQDLSIKNRPPSAYTRFKKVYQRFDLIVVGSDKMGVIFQEGFGVRRHQLLKTGVPRTDFFFRPDERAIASGVFKKKFPIEDNKKVILYAPTYRDNHFHISELQLNVGKMYVALKDSHVLFIRVHPTVKMDVINHYPDFVYNVSDDSSINHLLIGADILVTDYSSIPFEFSLLHKPMVFFGYDLDEYAHARGFWELYEDVVPGPIVENTDQLINVIKKGQFNMERIKAFAQVWNKYAQGNSSKHLIKAIFEKHY